MKLNKTPFILSGISMAILLASCGGGGGGDSDTVSTSTVTTTATADSIVTGTVPGTLIEAFCANGIYRHVSSTNNGTSEHPFSISLPSGVDCRLVMTTNENDINNRVITAIQINAGGITSGLVNLNANFNMGNIPLELDRNNIIDANNDGVMDSPLTVSLTLPSGVVVRQSSYDLLDKDGDGIPNLYEDDDNDGRHNHEDEDDDNDGIPDRDELNNYDHDGDGIDDLYDRDDDNDGLEDDRDSDDDNDGVRDEDDDDHHEYNETHASTIYTPVADYRVSSGRLLASQCAQCHGTKGVSVTSWDSLAGESASELIEEVDEYKNRTAGIMSAQAHGYSAAEIQALSLWFGNQSGSDSDSESESDNDD